MSLGKKKKKQKRSSDVDIPITPMLDMAFQLLTFFILTYTPSPQETSFAMNLVPAQAATKLDAQMSSDAASNADLPASLRTLDTGLRAAEGGRLGRISLGENAIDGMAAFEKELTSILSDKDLAFDQALIRVDPRLHFSEVMKVIDIYAKLKITKISFSEMTGADEGSPQ